MSREEFLIALFGILGGIGFLVFLTWSLFSLINNWINRKYPKSNQQLDPQFFKALGEFKRNTERRLTNLETLVSDIEEEHYLVKDENKSPEIKVEEKEPSSNEEKGGNLRNMLNE